MVTSGLYINWGGSSKDFLKDWVITMFASSVSNNWVTERWATAQSPMLVQLQSPTVQDELCRSLGLRWERAIVTQQSVSTLTAVVEKQRRAVRIARWWWVAAHTQHDDLQHSYADVLDKHHCHYLKFPGQESEPTSSGQIYRLSHNL